MGNSIKSSLRGRRRCGVCLFELDSTKAFVDIDIDWMMAFATRDTYEFTSEHMAASARQGCANCAALLSALERLGTKVFTTARWEPDMNPSGGKHPVLIIDDTDERFELFTASDDAARQGSPSLHPVVLAAKQLSTGSTGGEPTLRQAAEWLGRCRRDHEGCRPRDEGFVPTRLLFLGGEDAGVVRLVEHPAPSTVFAALSHRWTEETLGVRLERANLGQRTREGMPLAELPLMMRQVVAALRVLGIEHVWIDCLCIVQDDGDDWMREAATMASIYANAELTVGSTWGSKGGDGLFHDREGPAAIEVAAVEVEVEVEVDVDVDVDGRRHPVMLRRALPHFRWQEFRGGSWFSHDPRVVPDQEWPLLARGWVYQEQLLSRRMLHFARGEALWECFGARSCECGWHDADADAGSSSKRPADGKAWAQVLTEYAGRPLTFETDRLPAVAGIAKSVARAKGVLVEPGAYVCGLFTDEDDLRDTLFWYLAERPTGGRLDTKIPTWSWASVASTAMGFWPHLHEDITIGGVEASFPEGADPYMGQIEAGASITLTGRILEGTMHHGEDWAQSMRSRTQDAGEGQTKGSSSPQDSGAQALPDKESFVVSVGDRWATFHPDYKLDEPGTSFVASGAPVSCLLIGEATYGSSDPETGEATERVVPCFLVLRCVDAAGAPVYERLGMYESSECLDEEWMDLGTFVEKSAMKTFAMI